MSFTVDLPMPPSLNHAFANGLPGMKGRVKTEVYRNWLSSAGWAIKVAVSAERRIAGPYRVSINLAADMQGDIDNRVKGILDALVSSGRVDDDRSVEELRVLRRHSSGRVLVQVEAAND